MTELEEESARAIRQADFELKSQDAAKRLDYADAYAHAGLKALFLVNGASIVSLLTLIGNSGLEVQEEGIFWSFVWFTCGIASILIAYFGGYFSQNFYMRVSYSEAWNARFEDHNLRQPLDVISDRKTGNRWLAVAIAGAVLSFGFFVVGAFVALIAIT